MRDKAVKAIEKANADASATPAEEAPAPAADAPPAVQDAPVEEDTQPDEQQQPRAEGNDAEGEDFDLAPAGPLPPSELQAKLKASPELAAMLEKDPELRNSLFAASRLSQKAAQYDGMFPGGIEEAKFAAEGNKTFSNLSDLFTQVKDRKSTQAVLAEMMKLSYELDDEGAPVRNQNGQIKTNGTVGRFIEQTFGLGLDHWAGVAKEKGDDELAVAIDVLKARAFNTRAASAQEDMTEEQRTRQQELDHQQQQVTEQQQAIENEKRQVFETKADTAYYGHMDKMLDRVVAKATGLDEKGQADFRAAVKAKVDELIAQNPTFLAAQDAIWRRQGYGTKKLNDLTALGSRWINEVLPGVARDLLKGKGAQTVAAQQDRQARVDARTQASRSEPTAAMRHTAPAEMTTDQLHAKVRQDFQTKNGRPPSELELLRGVRELRSGGVRTT